jgi:GNAT superfamily N-acetyltransferase
MKLRTAMKLTFKPVAAQTWNDFESLFEARGGPKSCRCMAWRANADESKHADGASRKRCIHKRVEKGIPIGILGYIGREAVAWCSIAPKETYGNLTGEIETDNANVWSLVCFYLLRKYRSEGLAEQIIAAATTYAKENGARLEAYPVDTDSPSYRFMGHIEMFKSSGFQRNWPCRHQTPYHDKKDC